MTYLKHLPYIKVIVALIVSSFISSCGTQLKKTTDSADEAPWYQWGFSGKISIKVNSSNQNANLLWESEGSDYQILLYGPLGQGKITIEKDGEQLSLSQDGKVHYADSPEELLQQSTGLQLPISSLAYWVRGLSNPESAADIKKSYNGKIVSMAQQGWSIVYSSHYSANEWFEDASSTRKKRDISESSITANLFPTKARYLPRKIVLSKSSLQNDSERASSIDPSSIKVIIVVKEWQP